MYFDEDGDLAHEFYEEVRPSKRGKKSYMKKVTRRLLPQGLVELPFPRLHVDFPVVMCEAYWNIIIIIIVIPSRHWNTHVTTNQPFWI